MDTKKLRQKILDLAIHGKLVPQDPNDEPASVLLERIRAEKERLVKEGKIKKSKASKTSDTPHYENVPFEVPGSWEWCKLIDCCHIVGRIGFRGYTKEDLVNDGEGAITLSPSNIVNGLMNYDKCTFISWEKYEESPEIQVQSKDILLVKTGSSFGKCALIKHLPQKATINPQFVVLKHILINEEYLTWILQSNYARINYDSFVLGTAIPTFTQVVLGNMEIPLPPIEEQERIVAESKRWFALIELIEQGKADLQASIKQAKSKILDLAIHGKLVPQDPNDEPASELLKRINPKAEITCDNGQYGKMPNGWGLYKLGDVASYITDFVANGSFASLREHVRYYDGKEYAIIVRTKDFQNNFTKDLIYTDKHGYDFLSKSKLFGGELMLPNIGASIGKVFIIPNLNHPMTLGPNSVIISFKDDITKSWAYYLFLSPFGQELLLAISSSTAQGKFNKTDLRNTFFPLPPLTEQHRIVDAIQKAFAKLDAIMESL